jgi:membrane protein DedA with SNARE-associated domain
MVSGRIVEALVAVVPALGAPLLFALFYAEGLIVGKLLQPPPVFVAYVAVTRPGTLWLALVCLGCLGAATLGQWTLYRGVGATGESRGVGRVPFLECPAQVRQRVGEDRVRVATRLFRRYGAAGIVVTNSLPVVRSLASIPAGLGSYPRGRFLLTAAAGNAVFLGGLVAVAYGVVELGGLLV